MFTEYENDVFCTNLDPGESTFTAGLTAAEPGSQTLEVVIGQADITGGKAFVTDENALAWDSEFVIV